MGLKLRDSSWSPGLLEDEDEEEEEEEGVGRQAEEGVGEDARRSSGLVTRGVNISDSGQG